MTVTTEQAAFLNKELGNGSAGQEVKEVIFNSRDQYMYAMGCPDPIGKSLCSIFSGADICGFFNGEIVPVMSVFMFSGTTTSMEVILPLGEDAFKILKDKYSTFHLVGVTESGDKGLISGTCAVSSWKTKMSIDELNIEMSIVFSVTIEEMKGFMGVSKQTNEEITALWHELTKGKYKRKE